MSIQSHRANVEMSAKRLRRARRLYIRICSKAVLECPDNSVMIAMTNKMHERKLYADPCTQICWRDYRYRILRYIYRQHGSPGSHWSFWYKSLGFDSNFNKVSPARIA